MWRCVLERDGLVSDDKVRFWLHHIHVVQHAFQSVWRGESLDLPELTEFEDDLAALVRWGRDGHGGIRRFLDSAPPGRLDELLELPWAEMLTAQFGRAPEPITLGESAHQVALHSLHHRAQIAARVRELGGEPPLADFVAWLWLGRPEAEWPSP
jgi:uncharacterized damage-inducible protein DinB